MRYTLEEAIRVLSERTYDNTKDIKQSNRQRRDIPVDLYGVEYTRQGDGGAPATFYISITPDMIYLERFEFKLIVQPFASYSNGIETAEVQVDGTSLSVTENWQGHTVTPNPHSHTTQAHTHNLTSGITLTHTTASDFRISIEGIDITPYLMAQYGAWINGEGVYPSLDINENYDILEVACDMMAEGRESDANKLTRAGYKQIQITSNAPFQVTLVNYLKLSHLNR